MYRYPFLLLTLFGIWRPQNFTSKLLLWFYRFYTTTVIIVFYTFMISEVLDIVLIANDIRQVTQNMIQLVNVFNVSQKIICYLVKRNEIAKFMNLFFDDLTLPKTANEQEIKKKFDNESRDNSKKLFIIYSISVFTYVYLPFFISPLEDRVLPYRGWRPYSLVNVNIYYLTYVHHAFAVTIAASINAATEILVSGYMIQICAQFKILEERFIQLPKILYNMRSNRDLESKILSTEKNLVNRLVRHHLRIILLADILNNIFVFVILSQFIASVTVLCVSTYNLALCSPFQNEFYTILLYLMCMLLQIFLYTWYGNEITLKSVELGHNIFSSDWRSLNMRTIKDLLIIFQRTKRPIILSSGYVIILSNTAFTNIVKTSYSIYNVLSV